jgi:F0F1-type ATP synthase beta subunit
LKAVTAYNVIQALPKEELSELYKMLGVKQLNDDSKNSVKRKEKVVSKASIEEMLRATIFNLHK